jgi:hypothetical protein
MRWHLLASVSLLSAFLDAGLSASQGQVASAQEIAFGAQTPADRPVAPPAQQLAADPFQYRVPEGSGGFVPSSGLELPPGIRVLGILVLDDGQSLAALQLPGENEPAYVRENDDLQVRGGMVRGVSTVRQSAIRPSGAKAPAKSPARPVPPAAGAGGDVLYVKISKIAVDNVIVYPESNPTNLHVFR